MAENPSGSKYVTLVSSDLFEFVVLREATYISPVIKSMVDPSSKFIEARTGRCVFRTIRYVVLASLCYPAQPTFL
jgi:transcription elongation factor B subunit 1